MPTTSRSAKAWFTDRQKELRVRQCAHRGRFREALTQARHVSVQHALIPAVVLAGLIYLLQVLFREEGADLLGFAYVGAAAFAVYAAAFAWSWWLIPARRVQQAREQASIAEREREGAEQELRREYERAKAAASEARRSERTVEMRAVLRVCEANPPDMQQKPRVPAHVWDRWLQQIHRAFARANRPDLARRFFEKPTPDEMRSEAFQRYMRQLREYAKEEAG